MENPSIFYPITKPESFTTNTDISGYTGKGLSTYTILPKVKSFAMSGYNGSGSTAAADAILGGFTGTLNVLNVNFGLQNPRVHYLFTPTGYTAGRVIKYTYIDPSGFEQTGTQTITAVNTYYALPSAISINEFKLSGTNLITTSADRIFLSTSNTAANTLYVGSIYQQRNQSNGVFTCPKNAIAMITSIEGYCGTAFDTYYMNIYDESGNRSVAAEYIMFNNTVPNIRAAGGGDFGCLGRIIQAGESVVFSSSSATSVSKYITFNVTVRYF